MRRLSLLFAAVLSFGLASDAFARSEKTLAYPRDPAWQASVRFIRVDEQMKVTEKDADSGYVLFELRDEGKTFRGSLEVIDVMHDGRHAVRFVVTIEDRPSYVEIALLNRLEYKLRQELGSPSPAPTPRPKAEDKPKPKEDPKPERPKDPPLDDGGPPISNTP